MLYLLFSAILRELVAHALSVEGPINNSKIINFRWMLETLGKNQYNKLFYIFFDLISYSGGSCAILKRNLIVQKRWLRQYI